MMRLTTQARRVMRKYLVLTAAAACAVTTCSTLADDDVQTAGTSSTAAYQDVMFLGRTRPIIIRVHLEIDGRPFFAPWTDLAHRLFALADQNADGVLSESEWQSPPATGNSLRDELHALFAAPGLAPGDIDPPDGRLELSEFAALLAARRGGPFQPSDFGGSSPNATPQPVAMGQSSNAGSILFKAIDLLPDGRITIDELRQASDSLQRLDFDHDGASSIDELDHLRSPFVAVQTSPSTAQAIPILVLNAGEPSRGVMERLFATYAEGAPSSGAALRIEQLGLTAESRPEFDADDNGRLDRDELRHWLFRATPQIELLARIGGRGPDQPAVEIVVAPESEETSVKVSDSGLVSVIDGDIQLEFGVTPAPHTAESLRTAFVQAFKAFDRDGNGYVEPSETNGAPVLDQSFARYDHDGDGKIFEEELLRTAEADILLALSRTTVDVADRGKDLFEILDINRDRTLSRRELLDALKRFTLWDADDNGDLAEQEVPHLYQLVFARTTPPLAGLFVRGGTVPPHTGGETVAGTPSWFSKMDRNRDGDVSRREFIGNVDQFKQLDTDGDGLIGRTEALSELKAEPAASPP